MVQFLSEKQTENKHNGAFKNIKSIKKIKILTIFTLRIKTMCNNSVYSLRFHYYIQSFCILLWRYDYCKDICIYSFLLVQQYKIYNNNNHHHNIHNN